MSDYNPEHSKSGLLLVILAMALALSLVVGLLIVAAKY